MTDYTKTEQEEFERLRTDFIGFKMGFGPLADYHAIVAHFTLHELRKERGFDFRAAEARRLRQRLAEIDSDVMLSDSDTRPKAGDAKQGSTRE